MDNLEIYEKVRKAPKTALKEISAGKLKGYSDINPQWRIEVLTSVFGPCGIGWYTEITEHWVERETVVDKNGIAINESTVWVRLNLYVKNGNEWSKPIQGIGGSKQVGKGQGSEMNDEAYKMAETDAISVAAKKLGVAADVYWNQTDTKYTQGSKAPSQPAISAMMGNQSNDVYTAIKRAKTRKELDAIWNANPALQKDAQFVTEINNKSALVQ